LLAGGQLMAMTVEKLRPGLFMRSPLAIFQLHLIRNDAIYANRRILATNS